MPATHLAPGTTEGAPSSWKTVTLPAFATSVVEAAKQRRASNGAFAGEGPLLIAVDGRSGAGKSTLARGLAQTLREHGGTWPFLQPMTSCGARRCGAGRRCRDLC